MKKLSRDAVDEINIALGKEPFNAKNGAELYLRYAVNASLAKRFLRAPESMAKKIHWELSKLDDVSIGQYTQSEKLDAVTSKEIPAIILRIKKELEEVYKDRVNVQKALTDMGDDNSDATIKEAQRFGELADFLARRYEHLHSAKELYFEKGVIPIEKELFPEPDKAPDKEDSFGLKLLTDIQLSNRRRNLISSLTKDRNMLLYQTKTKQDEENPMPDGENRNTMKARIKEKEKELKAIEEMLKDKE